MRRHGVVVDAVSTERSAALTAGYSADASKAEIVYTADLFDRAALEMVVEHGLVVNCGSPDMISQLGEVRPGAEVTLESTLGLAMATAKRPTRVESRASMDLAHPN